MEKNNHTLNVNDQFINNFLKHYQLFKHLLNTQELLNDNHEEIKQQDIENILKDKKIFPLNLEGNQKYQN